MLMRAKAIDFHAVEEKHHAIDARLKEWGRYVMVRPPTWMHPMWRKGRMNGRQWEAPVIRDDLDIIRASETEKAVSGLPEPFRTAVRWCYVYRWTPAVAVREIGTTYQGLEKLVRDGRQMLLNRGLSC